MYLATYRQYEECNRQTYNHFITADTLDELHRKMSRIHYEALYDAAYDDPGHVNVDFVPYDRTKPRDWRVYKMEGPIDVESLPDYRKLFDARENQKQRQIASEASESSIHQNRRAADFSNYFGWKMMFAWCFYFASMYMISLFLAPMDIVPATIIVFLGFLIVANIHWQLVKKIDAKAYEAN